VTAVRKSIDILVQQADSTLRHWKEDVELEEQQVWQLNYKIKVNSILIEIFI